MDSSSGAPVRCVNLPALSDVSVHTLHRPVHLCNARALTDKPSCAVRQQELEVKGLLSPQHSAAKITQKP